MGRGEDASRLGPDGDGGDVVSHRVVQLAGQLSALPELDLVELTEPRRRPVTHRRAQRCREEQEEESHHRVDNTGVVEGDAQDRGDRDERKTDADLPATPPPRQRVGKQQDEDRRVEANHPVGVADHGREVDQDDRTERDHDGCQRMRTPPQQGPGQRDAEQHRDRPPHHVVAQQALEERGRHEDSDQDPVPPHARRRLRCSRFGPQCADGVSHHDGSVVISHGPRIGQEYGSAIGRSAG